MLGLRLALGAIALMAVLTASIGGLAVVDFDGNEETVNLVLTSGGDGLYWDALANGARAAAARRGVQLSVREGVVAEGCATLSIVGADESASCCGGAILSPHLFHVGMANYSAGRLCAHFAAKHVAVGGKIVVLTDSLDNSPSKARLQGFRDTLSYYEGDGTSRKQWRVEIIPIVDVASEHEVDDLATAGARHADAALVFDFTGGSAAVLVKSFPAGASDQRSRLVSFDSSEASLAAIETGELAAVVTHDPYQCGYQAVDRLVMYHRSDLLGRPAKGRGCIHVPAQLVERGTLAEYRSGLKTAAANAR